MRNKSENVSEIPEVVDGVAAQLHGFGVNNDELRQTHKLWLDNHVVPILEAGGSFVVVGEASRTGSQSHNFKLSKRRARNTIEYLRSQLNGRLNFSDITSLIPLGAGEVPAALNGQIDGTESSYYRAVRIAAWLKSTPPQIPIPKKKPEPQTLYKRVTKRSWKTFSDASRAGTADKMHDGSDGAALAGLVKSIFDAKTKGGSDKREYKWYPGDYAVTSVKHKNSTTIVRSHLLTTTERTTTVEYTWSSAWGKGTPVFLHKIDSSVQNWIHEKGKPPTIKVEKRYWPRKEVWKHTYAPNATVMG